MDQVQPVYQGRGAIVVVEGREPSGWLHEGYYCAESVQYESGDHGGGSYTDATAAATDGASNGERQGAEGQAQQR